MTSYRLNVHMTILIASIAYDFNLKLHPVYAVNVLLSNEQILGSFFFQTVVLASNNFMKL